MVKTPIYGDEFGFTDEKNGIYARKSASKVTEMEFTTVNRTFQTEKMEFEGEFEGSNWASGTKKIEFTGVNRIFRTAEAQFTVLNGITTT